MMTQRDRSSLILLHGKWGVHVKYALWIQAHMQISRLSIWPFSVFEKQGLVNLFLIIPMIVHPNLVEIESNLMWIELSNRQKTRIFTTYSKHLIMTYTCLPTHVHICSIQWCLKVKERNHHTNITPIVFQDFQLIVCILGTDVKLYIMSLTVENNNFHLSNFIKHTYFLRWLYGY